MPGRGMNSNFRSVYPFKETDARNCYADDPILSYGQSEPWQMFFRPMKRQGRIRLRRTFPHPSLREGRGGLIKNRYARDPSLRSGSCSAMDPGSSPG